MSQLFSLSEIKTKRIPYRIIFWTAILAGTLDMAYIQPILLLLFKIKSSLKY
jgi:fumarate reductase subunit D